MATRIETLMRNSASTHNGWTKTTTTDNEIFRSIKIGSQKSCNDDGIICDYTTESKIKDSRLRFFDKLFKALTSLRKQLPPKPHPAFK